MGIFRRTLSDRPDDLEECLFFVKAKQDNQIQGTGIACAVETDVRGEKKCFLLTSTDVKNKPLGRVFAHRCYRSWFRPKQNSVEVGHCYEDPKFSFILLDCISKKSLKLVDPDNIGKKAICRSFVITQRSFKTIYWEYSMEEQKYRLQEDTELEESAVLGSPVLWTDDHNQSYVVGVVGRADGVFFPDMFTSSSLKLTENLPCPSQVNQVQGNPNPSVPKPKPSDQNPTKPNPADQNTANPNLPNPSPSFTDLNRSTPKSHSSNPNPPSPNPRPTDPNSPNLSSNLTYTNPPKPKPHPPDTNPANPKPSLTDSNPPNLNPKPTDPNPPTSNPNPLDPKLPNPKPHPSDPNPRNINPNPADPNPPTSNPNPLDPKLPNPKPHPSDPNPRNMNPNPAGPNPPNSNPNPTDPSNPPNQNPNLANPNSIHSTPSTQPPNRIGNYASKLSSSVGILIFLSVIILGILLEMWTPWLTGRVVKPNSYLRKS